MRGYLKFVGVLEFLGYIFGIIAFAIALSKLSWGPYSDTMLNVTMVISFIFFILVGPAFAITVISLAGLSERVDEIQDGSIESLKNKIEFLKHKVDMLTQKAESESKKQEKGE